MISRSSRATGLWLTMSENESSRSSRWRSLTSASSAMTRAHRLTSRSARPLVACVIAASTSSPMSATMRRRWVSSSPSVALVGVQQWLAHRSSTLVLRSPSGPPSHLAPHHSDFTIALRLGASSHTRSRAAHRIGALGPGRRGRRIAPAGRHDRGADVRLRRAPDPDHPRRGPLPVDRPFGASAAFVRSPAVSAGRRLSVRPSRVRNRRVRSSGSQA